MFVRNWHIGQVASHRDAREVLILSHRTALRLYGVIKIKPLRGFLWQIRIIIYGLLILCFLCRIRRVCVNLSFHRQYLRFSLSESVVAVAEYVVEVSGGFVGGCRSRSRLSCQNVSGTIY